MTSDGTSSIDHHPDLHVLSLLREQQHARDADASMKDPVLVRANGWVLQLCDAQAHRGILREGAGTNYGGLWHLPPGQPGPVRWAPGRMRPPACCPAVAMSSHAAFNVAAAAQTAVGAASRSGRGFPHTLPVVGMQNVRM